MFATCQILGYNVFADELSRNGLFRETQVINTINAYSYVVAKKDKKFQHALFTSDILLPDGFPIVYAAKFLKRKKIRKIAGEEIFLFLLDAVNDMKGKVFFLGASEHALEKIRIKLTVDFPNIQVRTYSPPFKSEFSDEDDKSMIEAVNQFEPDVLFLGMTAPKQEKWVAKNRSFLTAKIICSVGAVFDFYAGTVRRPSKFWIDLRLEWFIRFLKEPKRLWKRYLYYSPQFFIDVFKAKVKFHSTQN